MSYHHLTESERYQIGALLKAGNTQKQIAEILDRSPSTISRELARNRGQRGYRPRQAQQKADERQAKSAANAPVIPAASWNDIEELLREDWSPEQIAGRTGLASSESIYLHIYRDRRSGGTLSRHLRCQKQRRKRYGSGASRRGVIRNRRPICERPADVDRKSRIGDWEGDTIIGARMQGALVTLADRRSQLVRIRKVSRRQAVPVSHAVNRLLCPLKAVSCTLTLDNGKEFAGHESISTESGVEVFFADPYASWQRGLNEQVNGLIRQYVPKNRSILDISDEEVAMIEKKLNNRPRKSLNYQTPLEVFNHLAEQSGVALRY